MLRSMARYPHRVNHTRWVGSAFQPVPATLRHQLHIIIKHYTKRLSSRNFQLLNTSRAQSTQVHHQRPQTVTMRHHQQPLPRIQAGAQFLLPAGTHTPQCILERFRSRQQRRRNTCIARVIPRPTLIAHGNRWRGAIKRTPPAVHQLLPHFLFHLPLIPSLQNTVMLLIQTPVFVHRNPGTIQPCQHNIERMNRPHKQRGTRRATHKPAFCQAAPGQLGLMPPPHRQRHICPASKSVVGIPLRFPMSQQHKFFHAEMMRYWHSTIAKRAESVTIPYV